MDYNHYKHFLINTFWTRINSNFTITLLGSRINDVEIGFGNWISKKEFLENYIPWHRYAYIKTFASLPWDVPKIEEKWDIMDGKIGPKEFVVVRETFFDPVTFDTQIYYSRAENDDIECMNLNEFLEKHLIRLSENG